MSIYNTKRWQRKRERILKRDGYMRQISKRYGKRIDANTVHHIYPVADYPQYAWCDWNLISLSDEWHNKMHIRETNELTEAGKRLMRKTVPPSS